MSWLNRIIANYINDGKNIRRLFFLPKSMLHNLICFCSCLLCVTFSLSLSPNNIHTHLHSAILLFLNNFLWISYQKTEPIKWNWFCVMWWSAIQNKKQRTHIDTFIYLSILFSLCSRTATTNRKDCFIVRILIMTPWWNFQSNTFLNGFHILFVIHLRIKHRYYLKVTMCLNYACVRPLPLSYSLWLKFWLL